MYKTIQILLILIFTSFALCVNGTDTDREKTIQKIKDDTLCVRIVGEIIDENQMPLDNVDVKISQTIKYRYDVPYEYMKLNTSKFQIDSRVPCSNIRIYMEKYNYTYVAVSISPSSEQEYPTSWDGDTIIFDVGKLEMKSLDSFNYPVSRYTIKGTFSPKSPMLEYSISKAYMRSGKIHHSGEITIAADQEEDIPADTVYCWANRVVDGKIESVILKTNSLNSGFIEVENIPAADRYDRFHTLEEAPESGYQAEIIIHIGKHKERYLFYFKQGDFYGKIMLDLNVGYYRKTTDLLSKAHPDGYINVNDEFYTITQELNQKSNDRELKSLEK